MLGTAPIATLATLATLAELVAPLAAADFRILLEAREPRHERTADRDRYSSLIDWDRMIAALSDDTFPATDIRLYRQRKKLPSVFVKLEAQARAHLVRQMLGDNASFIVNRVERWLPAIGRLCAALADDIGDNVSATLIATSGEGSALDMHFDPYDIVVLQIHGAKRWEIFADPVLNPVEDMPALPPAPVTKPVLTADLHAGDWLFVPAGYRHRCDTVDARSLHLSIMLYPLNLARIADLLKRQIEAIPADRAALRFAPEDAAEGEAAIKRALIARIEALSLDDLQQRHRDLPVVATKWPPA